MTAPGTPARGTGTSPGSAAGPADPGEAGPAGPAGATAVIRVVLPAHLRRLADTGGEVELAIAGPVTQRTVLDALEARYPVLGGTIRDRASGRRRPFIRFYACREDLSNESADEPLPAPVTAGTEPLLVVGAMAGG